MMIQTDRAVESLDRLHRYIDLQEYETSKQPVSGQPRLSIALSREAGSQGAEIARAVGQQLGWEVYDHELLDRIAEEKGLSAKLLEILDERATGWLENSIQHFCTSHSPREGGYLRGLLQVLASLGKVGHCVIVGRGAAQVLPRETTLSVRVTAARTDRVVHVQKDRTLSKAEAEQWVEETDRERLRFVKKHFRVDAEDPKLYDLILNSQRLGVTACAELIARAVAALEEQRKGVKAPHLG